jgi:hypothetical protein
MKTIKILALGLLLGGGIVCSPTAYSAEPKTPGEIKEVDKKEGDKTAEPESKPIPFQGKVSSVDAPSRTFTINGKTKERDRVFKVLDNTQILINNQQADFRSIEVGEIVRGQAYKRTNGWDAKKVMVGPKEEAPARR